MTALEVERMVVSFEGRPVLREVSFRVAAGEALGVIGPNGAGKTTMIDAVTGFVRYHGTVNVDGATIDALAPHERVKRGIARTFQGIEVFDDLTVRENVAVSPVSTPMSVEAALKRTGLVEATDRIASSLPRTTRGLVGLARALGCEPRVLLLDEIAAGLDQQERSFLLSCLRDIASSGVALVVVDHDLTFVEDLCGQVCSLDAGTLSPRGETAP